jgi:phage baseplate assembly protein W
MIQRRDPPESGAERTAPGEMPDPVPAPGWSLPLELGSDGAISGVRRAPIEDGARLVLEVVPGERPLLPAFGCRLHELRSLETERERQLAAALVEESLERWAPELGIERADVIPLEDGLVRVLLTRGGRSYSVEIERRHGGRRE